ncbi:MAG TPA: DNA recombination protein RmuC [Gaiellaceae bacterium]|nr:DNA recombination protein RmuC [Gaiellaceae bacterium]
MTTAATLLIGLLAGAAIAFALVLPRLARRRRENAVLASSVVGLRAQLETKDAVLGERLRDAIHAASADAYRQTNAAFLELAGTKLEGTVEPLRDSLRRVDEQVQQLDRARARSEGALRQQLTDLSERTATLATALRSPHVRGRWGEVQLRRVVELAGMLPYCDFAEQVTATTEDGRLRPDLLVRLPGGKQVVVDAKVPLAAYLDALEARDEDVRARKLSDHARLVREHLGKLSEKRYWQQFADSPDFVVMFLPDEGFFRAAWEQDAQLMELGVRARVHIASPTTLIAILQAVAFGWQQEKVAEDARAVHAHGTELYKRLATMGGHFAALGASLDRTVERYNKTVASLESRVLPEARKLEAHVIVDEPLGDIVPVARKAVAPAAPELVQQPSLEVLPSDADAA